MTTQPVEPAATPTQPLAPTTPTPPSGQGQPEGQQGQGFPPGTAVADMTAEQQVAYWRHHAQKHEGRAKSWAAIAGGRTAEQMQADLAELASLRQGQQTDAERAVAEAWERGQAETRAQYAPRLASAEFRAALAHVPQDRLDAIIDGLNLAAYVGDDGQVDTDRVRAYAQQIAPVVTTTQQQSTGHDFGAGRRPEHAPARGAAGKAEAERRFGKPTAGTAG